MLVLNLIHFNTLTLVKKTTTSFLYKQLSESLKPFPALDFIAKEKQKKINGLHTILFTKKKLEFQLPKNTFIKYILIIQKKYCLHLGNNKQLQKFIAYFSGSLTNHVFA